MNTETDILKQIIEAQDEYINILTEDLNSAANSAAYRGWQSQLVEEGEKARKKIIDHRQSYMELTDEII